VGPSVKNYCNLNAITDAYFCATQVMKCFFYGKLHHINFLLCSYSLGNCPPCPQTVSISCFCSKSPAQVRRCSSQAWSCGQKCSKLLSCGAHKCGEICHDSICPPCPRKSTQKCLCGRKKEERPCDSIDFQCDQVQLTMN